MSAAEPLAGWLGASGAEALPDCERQHGQSCVTGAHGACGSEIASRLITGEPDISRLLDRMEKRGWISRRRDVQDRRFVTARITPAGLETLAALDTPIVELHRRQFESLSGAELAQLTAVVEKLLV